MSNYDLETKCLHSGYTPKKGEPCALPIYQSTTFKYDTTDEMGQLFDRDRTVISRRIRSIFNEKELSELDNVQIMHIVNSLKPVEFYSLDVIISVGYRVKSQRGVEFRKLATSVLRDYIIKGYAENKRRLNQLNQIMSIN